MHDDLAGAHRDQGEHFAGVRHRLQRDLRHRLLPMAIMEPKRLQRGPKIDANRAS